MRAAIARHSNGNDETDELDSPVEALEQGSLAISTTNIVRELWQRPYRRALRQPILNDGSTSLRFEISYARVMPPDGENANIKKYVVYGLLVRQDVRSIDRNQAIIHRRYTDFLELYTGLRKTCPEIMQKVVFPKKVLMGNFSDDLIAERSTAFEALLDHISDYSILRDSVYFLQFLQNIELVRACQLLDERRNEQAVPLLENSFQLLNKVFTDRSKAVLLMLCRLVAACTTSPVPHPSADKWAELALRRYEGVSDTDLLSLYIPLLQTCVHLWWQRGRDNLLITERLNDMSKKGIKITGGLTLAQAIHKLDPQTETI